MVRSLRSLSSLVPSLAVLGLLAGCGRTETRPISLDDLSRRALTFALVDIDALENPDAAGSHRFTVTLAQAEDGCTSLVDGVTATFNGQPMELEPGGISGEGGREVCVETRAWFDFDPEAWDSEPIEDARVFLQSGDGSRSLSLIVLGAKAKRHFTFQGSGSGATLRQGQTYTYRWEPVEEVPGPFTVTLLREGGQASATLQTNQDEGSVSFTLPQATPVATHLLTLKGTVAGQVLECEGVASCEGSLFHSTDFEVAVVP
ncbi:GPI anchored serine-threonine rich family protein [Hyalangium gracile]|uniref:GPI anchored serine-threonine rich family protein n=1 Tax=Hyalangium gracile TaxID=394092 RepID=UPI001CCE6F0A|nr:GPI anchored serine-threonine rich family protein [Hyalangium gracile]